MQKLDTIGINPRLKSPRKELEFWQLNKGDFLILSTGDEAEIICFEAREMDFSLHAVAGLLFRSSDLPIKIDGHEFGLELDDIPAKLVNGVELGKQAVFSEIEIDGRLYDMRSRELVNYIDTISPQRIALTRLQAEASIIESRSDSLVN